MVTVNFNNKNSKTDYDLILEERPAIPLTLENIESITIEGRSGTLTRRLGTYNDKVITCKFILLSKTGLSARITAVMNWLNSITDNTLSFSHDASRKYKVKAVSISENIQEMLRFYGRFEVTFTCEPFAYPTSETSFSTANTSFTVNNPGTVKTDPYIRITGSGAISLTVNSQTVNFSAVTGYIEIDSYSLMCYKDSTNQMAVMSGDFPRLEVGTNTISLTGTVTQVDILVRDRYL